MAKSETQGTERSPDAGKVAFIGNMFGFRLTEKEIISRSGLFDRQFYANANPDVIAAGADPLDHYLAHGRLEGRRPFAEFDPKAYLDANPDLDPDTTDPFLHYIRQGKKEGRPLAMSLPPMRRLLIEQVNGMALTAAQENALSCYYSQLKMFLESPRFVQKLKSIQEIEKGVTNGPWTKVNIPPSNDARYFVHRELRSRLAKTHYDTLICLPSAGMKDGEKVVELLLRTLNRIGPNETVLLIDSQKSGNRWAGLMSGNIDLIDLSDLLPYMRDDAFADLFLVTLWGLSPTRWINIDSSLFFNTCLRYSRQISQHIHLYSYWNEAATGQAEQLFSTFLQQCFPHLEGILTDSDQASNRLCEQYAIPETYSPKVVSLAGISDEQISRVFKSEAPKPEKPAKGVSISPVLKGSAPVIAKSPVDITAVLTVHREGLLCGPTLINFNQAIQFARNAGLSVEGLVICDRTNDLTEAIARQPRFKTLRVELIDGGDPAYSRNAAVEQAAGSHIALLDGDDFWCEDWLVACERYRAKLDRPCILHPAFNVFFGQTPWIMVHPDSTDASFDVDCLRLANSWTSLCFAARDVFLQNKYQHCELSSGFGHEDWSWNCQTLAEGIHHRPCPETFHVIRERHYSRSAVFNARAVAAWPTKLASYEQTGSAVR